MALNDDMDIHNCILLKNMDKVCFLGDMVNADDVVIQQWWQI